MKVRGERVLVFGDSLTQHSAGNEVWDVDTGSNRNSSGPGDLLASLLLEQGAQAVRTNARVSRSAVNFWTREDAGSLVAADIAWRPTKVVFVMGTNDIGLNTASVQNAYAQLKAAYAPTKAKLWAIGPFVSSKPVAQVDLVARAMKAVFGQRFIDGRRISTLIKPGSDGIHYTPSGARALALNMANALISARIMPSWAGYALGAGVVISGALIYGLYRRRKALAGLEGDDLDGVNIVDGRRFDGSTNELIRNGYREIPCKSGLDRSGLATCWSKGRGLGALPPGGAHIIEDAAIAAARRNRVGNGAYLSDVYIEVIASGKVDENMTFEEFKKEVKRMAENGAITVTANGPRPSAKRDVMKVSKQEAWIIEPYGLETAVPVRKPAALSPPTSQAPRAADSATLLAITQDAIKRIPSAGRFGPEKVFVSDIWDEVNRDPRSGGVSLPAFKQWLLSANRQGELVLVRADMISAMDPNQVNTSRIDDKGAVFHFVLDRGGKPAKGPARTPRVIDVEPTPAPSMPSRTQHNQPAQGGTLTVSILEDAMEATPAWGSFIGKRFVSDVYESARSLGVNMSLSEFKRAVNELRRRGDVILERADLVGAMDPQKVASSEVRDSTSVWHFLVPKFKR